MTRIDILYVIHIYIIYIYILYIYIICICIPRQKRLAVYRIIPTSASAFGSQILYDSVTHLLLAKAPSSASAMGWVKACQNLGTHTQRRTPI